MAKFVPIDTAKSIAECRDLGLLVAADAYAEFAGTFTFGADLPLGMRVPDTFYFTPLPALPERCHESRYATGDEFGSPSA